MAKHKILIVDDEKLILDILERILRTQGYEIYLADSGTMALELMREVNPVVVVVDIYMDDMSGLELMRRMQLTPEDSYAVIGITGHGDVAEESECAALGAYGFLRKPLEMETIQRMIRQAIRDKTGGGDA